MNRAHSPVSLTPPSRLTPPVTKAESSQCGGLVDKHRLHRGEKRVLVPCCVSASVPNRLSRGALPHRVYFLTSDAQHRINRRILNRTVCTSVHQCMRVYVCMHIQEHFEGFTAWSAPDGGACTLGCDFWLTDCSCCFCFLGWNKSPPHPLKELSINSSLRSPWCSQGKAKCQCIAYALKPPPRGCSHAFVFQQ